MTEPAQKYQHSGRITVAGLLFGLAAGGVAALVLSVPYAYIVKYVPFIYLNFLATGAFGALVGMLAAMGARAGNLQSSVMYRLLGLVSGALAVYFSWVFWIFALTEQRLLSFDPEVLYALGRLIMEKGTWGLGRHGDPVTGWFLGCVWLAEAGAILVCSYALCLSGLTSYACCPLCQKWFKSPMRSLHFQVPENPGPAIERLGNLDFGCLPELSPSSGDKKEPGAFLTLDLYRCPACAAFSFFSLKMTKVWQEKKEIKTSEQTLLERLLIPAGSLAGLEPAQQEGGSAQTS
jgi:hypothetical protein